MPLTPRQRERRPPPRGLSLIELAVAIVILSIGTLAVIRATDQGTRALAGAAPRALAALVAENRAEELRAFGTAAALPDRVTMGGRDFVIETARAATAGGLIEARITVQGADGGPGALLVAILPAQGLVSP